MSYVGQKIRQVSWKALFYGSLALAGGYVFIFGVYSALQAETIGQWIKAGLFFLAGFRTILSIWMESK